MKKYLWPIAILSLNTSFAATQKGFEAEAYGFIKASGIYASEALASYNYIIGTLQSIITIISSFLMTLLTKTSMI